MRRPPRAAKPRPVVPPVMSMSELARLGGGKVAYIRVMTADEAKEMFPAVEGIPTRHQPLCPACRRRHADCADRQPPVGARPRHGRRAGDRQRALRRSARCHDQRSDPGKLHGSQETPGPQGRAFSRRGFAAALARRTIVAAHAWRGRSRMTPEMLDRLAIREVVENWAVWRDAGDWERFRTRLARRRPHDGDLVPGPGGGVHRGAAAPASTRA